MLISFQTPLELMAIKEEGYHIFILIKVHGHEVRMLLDTGASRTVFDSGSLKEIYAEMELEENEDKATGLGSNTVDNYIGMLKQIEIGPLVIADYQVGVMDLQHVNESYATMDMPQIAGVIGSDLLVKYNAVIDFGERSLRLSFS
jgi:predicted aspartyl protease